MCPACWYTWALAVLQSPRNSLSNWQAVALLVQTVGDISRGLTPASSAEKFSKKSLKFKCSTADQRYKFDEYNPCLPGDTDLLIECCHLLVIDQHDKPILQKPFRRTGNLLVGINRFSFPGYAAVQFLFRGCRLHEPEIRLVNVRLIISCNFLPYPFGQQVPCGDLRILNLDCQLVENFTFDVFICYFDRERHKNSPFPMDIRFLFIV